MPGGPCCCTFPTTLAPVLLMLLRPLWKLKDSSIKRTRAWAAAGRRAAQGGQAGCDPANASAMSNVRSQPPAAGPDQKGGLNSFGANPQHTSE